MKAMKKVMALGLALAMVVTAVPATPVEAASTAKLSTKKVTVAVGTEKAQTKNIKVTTPSTWKSVKVTASSSKKSVAKVKVSGKTVKVTAVKKGSAKVTVKVSYKKSTKKNAKTYTKKLYATAKTVNAGARFTEAPDTVAVNETASTTLKVCPTTATATYASSDEKVATVDANGVITGVAAGKATITATTDYGKTATKEVTVKTAILKSAAQKKSTQIVATFAGDTSKLAKKDIIITNTANNVVYPVKDINVKSDKTTVEINTFTAMNDGKEYTVAYDGVTAKFTATDGVVADVAVSTTEITKGTPGTEVKGQTLDKNGVIIDEYNFGGSTDGKVEVNISENKGYTDDKKLVLLNTGDTATVQVVYHTFKYENGAEIGKIDKKFVVTAVDDATTVSNFQYTIDSAANVNWNNTVVTNNKIAKEDSATAFFYIKDSNGNDVTTNYSVESSDKSILLLAKTSLVSRGTGVKGSAAVKVTGVKAGNAYINVIDGNGKIVQSLPVVVQETRKLTSLKLGSNALTVSNTAAEALTSVSTGIKAYDQYGDEAKINTLTAKIIGTPSGDTTHKDDTFTDNNKAVYANDTLTLGTQGSDNTDTTPLAEGTYNVELEATTNATNFDQTVKVKSYVTLTVVDTTNATVSYGLDISAKETDLNIASSKTNADIKNNSIKVSVAAFKKGAKVANVTGSAITVKDSKGNALNSTNGYTDDSATTGIVEQMLYDGAGTTADPTTKNLTNLGTYTVEATYTVAGVDKKFSGSFVVKDTQEKATVSLNKDATPAVTHTGVVATDALAVLNDANVKAEFYYDGYKQVVGGSLVDGTDVKIGTDVKENATGTSAAALYIGTIQVKVTNTAGQVIWVPVEINTTFVLK